MEDLQLDFLLKSLENKISFLLVNIVNYQNKKVDYLHKNSN
jgi:hypothetical protein